MKTAAIIWGLFFLVLGLMGMVPAFAIDGLIPSALTGSPMHSALYWVTGLIGLIVGLSSRHASRFYFEIVGVIYALLAIFGFFQGAKQLSESMPFSAGGAWFHAIVALMALFLGYLWRREPMSDRSMRHGHHGGPRGHGHL